MKKPEKKKKKKPAGGIMTPKAPSKNPGVDTASRQKTEDTGSKPTRPVVKKDVDRKGKEEKKGGTAFRFVQVAIQFLREARMELKKVKWPTRKELLASTVMVITLVLFAALFLGLIDFGLIKIIKNIVG